MFARKPPLPSFWQDAQWKEWLTPVGQDHHDGLPDLPEFEEARAVISALDPHASKAPPVSLASALRAAKSLNTWFESATTHLTWPPTIAGFSAAARPLFAVDATSEDRWVLGLLDALRPDLVALAHHDYKATGNPSWLEAAQAAPEPTAPAASRSGPRSHAASAIVLEWINELRARSDAPLPLLKEELDGKIKRSVVASKGTGSRARNYWLEDVLIPALTDLTTDDLRDLLHFWPQHQKSTFNDPTKAMEARNFWNNLRNMEPAARRFLLSDVLPALVDTSDWTPAQRLEMLEPMIIRIKAYPNLVRQNLDLWKAWGGDLDQQVDLPIEEGALSAPVTTARTWLATVGVDPDNLEALASNTPPRRRTRGPR